MLPHLVVAAEWHRSLIVGHLCQAGKIVVATETGVLRLAQQLAQLRSLRRDGILRAQLPPAAPRVDPEQWGDVDAPPTPLQASVAPSSPATGEVATFMSRAR